jgi:hypothetical protein
MGLYPGSANYCLRDYCGSWLEVIPCLDDLLPITQAMEFAFSQQGARSVCIQLPHGAVRYHLSKVC